MALNEDDIICYCFHVPKRKVTAFCRNTQPQHASQVSQCLSAGTGCGWCIPMLRRIHREVCGVQEPWWRQTESSPQTSQTSADEYADGTQYADARRRYLARKQPSQE